MSKNLSNITLSLRRLELPEQAVEQIFLDKLERIGMECVSKARTAGTYGNVTGNLRSSIGFCIINNGSLYRSSQPQAFAGKKGNGAKGVSTHNELIPQLQKDFNNGIYLFVFAGMKYAKYVQNMGFDVLKASETLLNTLIVKL